MGLSYLNDKNWSDITREERHFCAELYCAIKGNEKKFVEYIKKLEGMEKLDDAPDQDWEVAIEVCLYRDLFKFSPERKGAGDKKFSDRRTFDLCLFSKNQIVVIEAKAQGGFKGNQLDDIKDDKDLVSEALDPSSRKHLNVFTVALASSKYFRNIERYSKDKKVLNNTDAQCTWMDLYNSFNPNIAFSNADNLYKNGKSNNSSAQKLLE